MRRKEQPARLVLLLVENYLCSLWSSLCWSVLLWQKSCRSSATRTLLSALLLAWPVSSDSHFSVHVRIYSSERRE